MSHLLIGQVVKASSLRVADLGLIPAFSVGLIHISDIKIGTLVATLPWTWLYGVSSETG